MTLKREDGDYWNESDVTGFSFDDEEVATASSFFQPSRLGGTGNFQEILGGAACISDFNEPLSAVNPLTTLVSRRSLALIFNEEVTDKPFADPKEELAILRRQLAGLNDPPPIEITIRSILLGKPYSLHLYRSYDLKSQLLNHAVQLGDGNVILAVVLFLRKTLAKNLFVRLLQFKPAAVPVYINYLSTKYEFRTAVDILSVLGQTRDAAFKNVQYLIQPEQSLDKRSQCLRVLLRDHFSAPGGEDKIFIDNFFKLVEWQLSVGPHNEAVRGTVVEVLAYLCCKHWNELRGHQLSPQNLITLLSVSERQFHWTAFTSLADCGSWGEIGGLFFTKGWLGGKKLKSVLAADKIVKELHRRQCPESNILEYFELVDSLDKRLALAKSLAWHKGVIDTYSAMRDRQGLVQYQASINPQSNDYLHAETLLRANIKWRN